MGKSSGGVDMGNLINQQEQMNRVNIFSPYGTQMYGSSQVDDQGNIVFAPSTGDDQRAMQIIETPFQTDQRQTYENIAGLLGSRAQNMAGQMPSNAFSGTPDLNMLNTTPANYQMGVAGLNMQGLIDLPGINDFSGDATRLEDATFQRGANRLNPVFDEQRMQIEQGLADRGIPIGSEAYSREMDRFDRSRGDALENLTLSSIGAGREEQSRLFGLALAGRGQQFGERSRQFDTGLAQGQFYNQAQGLRSAEEMQRAQIANAIAQQQFGNDITSRNQGFNELGLLMGQSPSMPLANFQGPGAIDVMGPQIAQMNAQNANRGNLFGSLLSAGTSLGSAALLSSRAFKEIDGDEDTEALLKAIEKLPVQRWRYKGDQAPHVGTMAEDWRDVTGLGDGQSIAVVDAIGVMMGAMQALAKRVRQLEGAA